MMNTAVPGSKGNGGKFFLKNFAGISPMKF